VKRFVGYLLVGIGGLGTIVGAYHVATGKSEKLFYGVQAMYIGLMGIAMLVMGLTMARD